MTELDEVSHMLGEIKSDTKHIVRWCDTHEESDERRFQALSDRISKHNGYSNRIEVLETRVDAADVVIKKVKDLTLLGKGMLMAASLLGGVVSASAVKLLSWF